MEIESRRRLPDTVASSGREISAFGGPVQLAHTDTVPRLQLRARAGPNGAEKLQGHDLVAAEGAWAARI